MVPLPDRPPDKNKTLSIRKTGARAGRKHKQFHKLPTMWTTCGQNNQTPRKPRVGANQKESTRVDNLNNKTS